MSRAVEFAREALLLAALLSMPSLVAGFAVSLVIGLAASRLQLGDPAISHPPRVLAVSAALALSAGWLGATLLRFTRGLWDALPTLVY